MTYTIFVHIIYMYLMEIHIYSFDLHFNKTINIEIGEENSLDIELKVKSNAKLGYNSWKAMKVRSTQSLPEFIMSRAKTCIHSQYKFEFHLSP